MQQLGIVRKTVAVCNNLNCSYCYCFNGIGDAFKRHSPYIASDTIACIPRFLKQGIAELQRDAVCIGAAWWSGNAAKTYRFNWICGHFMEQLAPYGAFVLQTNGMPLHQAWVALMQKDKMGVSLDVPKALHEKHQVDHTERGSYDKAVEKIHFFNAKAQRRNIRTLGVLSVINSEPKGKACYRLFVEGIGRDGFNFLFPNNNDCNPHTYTAEQDGRFMGEALDEWTKDDHPDTTFSFIKSTLALFFGGTSISYGISPGNKAQILLVTVATHGHLSPVNEWRATDLGMMHTANVATPSLKNFLAIPLCQEIAERQQNSRAPCCWENSCGGGGTLHRFSHKSTLPRPPSTVRDVCMGIKQRPGGRYAQKK